MMMYSFFFLLAAIASAATTFPVDPEFLLAAAAPAVATAQSVSVQMRAKEWRKVLAMLDKFVDHKCPVPRLKRKYLAFFREHGLLHLGGCGRTNKSDGSSAYVCVGITKEPDGLVQMLDIHAMKAALKGLKPSTHVTLTAGGGTATIESEDSICQANVVANVGDDDTELPPVFLRPDDSFGNVPAPRDASRPEFVQALKAALPHTSTDESKPAMQGVLVNLYNEDWSIVATDAHKLYYEASRTGLHKDDAIVSFILPASTLKQVLTAKAESMLLLGMNENRVMFAVSYSDDTPNMEVVAYMVDGRFPGYRNVMPGHVENDRTTEDAFFVEFDAEEWLAQLGSVDAPKRTGLTKIAQGEQGMSAAWPKEYRASPYHALEPEAGFPNSVPLPCTGNPENVQDFGINVYYLQDLLKSWTKAGVKRLRMVSQNANSPVYFEPADTPDEGASWGLIMPIMLGVYY